MSPHNFIISVSAVGGCLEAAGLPPSGISYGSWFQRQPQSTSSGLTWELTHHKCAQIWVLFSAGSRKMDVLLCNIWSTWTNWSLDEFSKQELIKKPWSQEVTHGLFGRPGGQTTQSLSSRPASLRPIPLAVQPKLTSKNTSHWNLPSFGAYT